VIEIVDERIVHRAAELRMWMQHERHRRSWHFLALVAGFDSSGGTWQDDVGHGFRPARPR